MNTETHQPHSICPQTTIPAIALAALLALAPTAFADPPVLSGTYIRAAKSPAPTAPLLSQKTMMVKLNDLDLTDESGVRTANERIRAAAKKACTFTTDMGGFVVDHREVFLECFRQTVSNATVQLEQRQLVARQNRDFKVAGK